MDYVFHGLDSCQGTDVEEEYVKREKKERQLQAAETEEGRYNEMKLMQEALVIAQHRQQMQSQQHQ